MHSARVDSTSSQSTFRNRSARRADRACALRSRSVGVLRSPGRSDRPALLMTAPSMAHHGSLAGGDELPSLRIDGSLDGGCPSGSAGGRPRPCIASQTLRAAGAATCPPCPDCGIDMTITYFELGIGPKEANHEVSPWPST